MSNAALRVLVVSGSTSQKSQTRALLKLAAEQFTAAGCATDLLDLAAEPLALFNPEVSYQAPGYAALKARVEAADVLVLGTPDYHGCMSSALKNFLDHFWKEFAGKLFVTLVGSFEKGLTVADEIRTVARQSYAWALPYAVTFTENTDIKDGQIINDTFRQRLEMMTRDVRVYGDVLARQRRADLAGAEPGFMARYRKA